MNNTMTRVATLNMALFLLALLFVGAGCFGMGDETTITAEDTAEEMINTESDTSDESDDSDTSMEAMEESDSDDADDTAMVKEEDSTEDAVDEDVTVATVTSTEDGVVALEHSPEESDEQYRVWLKMQPASSAEWDSAVEIPAAVEYRESEDDEYETIHSFSVSGFGTTTFSVDDTQANTFFAIRERGYEYGTVYVVNSTTQKVYPLDGGTSYYYVSGGTEGSIISIPGRNGNAVNEAGIILEYYDGEEQDCTVYGDVVDETSVSLSGTEVTFTPDTTGTDVEAEEQVLDIVEECSL